MKVKRGTPVSTEAILVGTRVPPSLKAQFEEAARENNRSVAGELRHMIERRVEGHLADKAAA